MLYEVSAERIDHAEKFFGALGATIRHGGNRAFYSIATNAIQMPAFVSFQDADSYYTTLAHECIHWTGSKTRLDRDFGGHRFGSEGYAVEELVAELGVAAAPHVFLEGNYASGTRNQNGHEWNTFDQLYPSNHDKLGFADLVGRRNLVHFRTGVEE
jgi:antirestriction protein ArdC